MKSVQRGEIDEHFWEHNGEKTANMTCNAFGDRTLNLLPTTSMPLFPEPAKSSI